MRIDLHSHSTYSDGVLTPAALIERASRNRVTLLALTDHDEVRGLPEAAQAVREACIGFVPGVEISVTWAGLTVHVVGLGIDPRNPSLDRALAGIRDSRGLRAAQIAQKLGAAGVPNSLEGATRLASDTAVIGRGHFARFLVEQGHAASTKAAFKKYLSPGRCAYVAHQWVCLGHAIGWIREAGGHAVLAHPDRYRLTPLRMHALLDEFKQHGGQAIEVGGGLRANPLPLVRLARHFGFSLSAGSDFHVPTKGSADLGDIPAFPEGARGLWQDWEASRFAA
ncbi:MAG: PHP domain-containing protein [Betaproteobacteria bacterium]